MNPIGDDTPDIEAQRCLADMGLKDASSCVADFNQV